MFNRLKQPFHVAVHALAGVALVGAAWAQERSQDGRPSFGGQNSDTWRRMQDATPEERREMMMDRWVDMLDRTYELNDEQRKRVREEIQHISDDYRQKLGPQAEELDRLREQMRDYWQKRREQAQPDQERTDPREDPEFRRLSDRMREITESTSFDWRDSVARIEELLPEEQVELGRQRRQAWWQGMRERMEDARERMEQSLKDLERQLQARPDNEALRARLEEARRRMEQWNRWRENGSWNGADRNERDNSTAWGGRFSRPDSPNPAQAGEPAPPPHPWDVYVRDFTARYRLDAGQSVTAQSILNDLKQRETTLLKVQAPERAKLAELNDAQAKADALKKLDEPIDKLFKELQTRLNALLTSPQKGEPEKG